MIYFLFLCNKIRIILNNQLIFEQYHAVRLILTQIISFVQLHYNFSIRSVNYLKIRNNGQHGESI